MIHGEKRDVASVCLVRGGMIFLSQRLDGLWQNPGGKLELGEAPVVAAVREVYEETGLYFALERMEPLFSAPHPTKGFIVHGFVVRLTDEEFPQSAEDGKTLTPWLQFTWADARRLRAVDLLTSDEATLLNRGMDRGLAQLVLQAILLEQRGGIIDKLTFSEEGVSHFRGLQLKRVEKVAALFALPKAG